MKIFALFLFSFISINLTFTQLNIVVGQNYGSFVKEKYLDGQKQKRCNLAGVGYDWVLINKRIKLVFSNSIYYQQIGGEINHVSHVSDYDTHTFSFLTSPTLRIDLNKSVDFNISVGPFWSYVFKYQVLISYPNNKVDILLELDPDHPNTKRWLNGTYFEMGVNWRFGHQKLGIYIFTTKYDDNIGGLYRSKFGGGRYNEGFIYQSSGFKLKYSLVKKKSSY